MRRHETLWRAVEKQARGTSPAPFIVGVSRSGTTLLRLMLDAHPDLAIPPETHFVPEAAKCADAGAFVETLASHPRWRDHGLDAEGFRRRVDEIRPFDPAEALRTFYLAYAERLGKRRWGDKTPRYLREMPLIERMLPEARFVHLIRDGRDVALSGLRAGFGPKDVEGQARRWRSSIEQARTEKPEHYLEARYEDLILEPEKTLRGVCEFVKLPFESSMLRYHEGAQKRIVELDNDIPGAITGKRRVAMHAATSEPPKPDKVGGWRTEMSSEDKEVFKREAGTLLVELDYERSDDW